MRDQDSFTHKPQDGRKLWKLRQNCNWILFIKVAYYNLFFLYVYLSMLLSPKLQ